MAPETGLEPVTRRLIPTGRDSTSEQQLLANPSSGFHTFNLAFAFDGRGSRGMLFPPNEFPWAILTRKLSVYFICVIMRLDT